MSVRSRPPLKPRRCDRSAVETAGTEGGGAMTTTWTATRRGVLGRGVALAGAVGLGAPLAASAATRAGGRRRPPIEHVVIDCQENRSFDHYYGYAPWVGQYGIPAGLLPARRPRRQRRARTTSRARPRPTSATPGRRSTASGTTARWTASSRPTARLHGLLHGKHDLPFYYGLFETSTLCVNYFCSVLGPDLPQPVLPGRRARPAASRPTASGATACSTTRSSSTCSRTPA